MELAAIGQIQARLKSARQALEENDLAKAEEYFNRMLAVEGDHPDRTSIIRTTLKEYSDRVTDQQTPPDWRGAQEALEMLTRLKMQTGETLQTEESEGWWRELRLKEADDLLKQSGIEESFQIFVSLVEKRYQPDVRDQLDIRIVDIVRDHIAQCAQRGTWTLADQIVANSQKLWENNAKRLVWLRTVSDILKGAETRLVQTEQDIRQYRSFLIILSAIFIISGLAFGWLFWQY